MKSEAEVKRAAEQALEKGAQGICWFVYPVPKPEHKKAIAEATALI